MRMYQLSVKADAAVELHEITAEVVQHVGASGIAEGLCYVFIPHTTAGVTINENADPDVRRDLLHTLNRLIP